MQIDFYSKHFESFINNPFISRIATEPRWTISVHKKPIDIRLLLEKDRFVGASFGRGYNPLTTLPALTDLFLTQQNVLETNLTYYLNAAVNRQIILDIEPSCPKEIIDTLFNTMPWEYAETSLSGKGVHLGLTLPVSHSLFFDELSVLKGPGKYYEYLMQNRYIAFTMNQIHRAQNNPCPPTKNLLFHIEPLYTQWKARQLGKKEFALSLTKPNIPKEARIRKVLDTMHIRKTLADYDNDCGRYEFACGCAFFHRIKRQLHATKLAPSFYDKTMLTWLVYESLVNFLTPRAKHTEFRNGLPWLLYLSQQVVAKAEVQAKNDKGGGPMNTQMKDT